MNSASVDRVRRATRLAGALLCFSACSGQIVDLGNDRIDDGDRATRADDVRVTHSDDVRDVAKIPLPDGSTFEPESVVGSGVDDLWSVAYDAAARSHVLYHYNGASWRNVRALETPFVASAGEGRAWIVTHAGIARVDARNSYLAVPVTIASGPKFEIGGVVAVDGDATNFVAVTESTQAGNLRRVVAGISFSGVGTVESFSYPTSDADIRVAAVLQFGTGKVLMSDAAGERLIVDSERNGKWQPSRVRNTPWTVFDERLIELQTRGSVCHGMCPPAAAAVENHAETPSAVQVALVFPTPYSAVLTFNAAPVENPYATGSFRSEILGSVVTRIGNLGYFACATNRSAPNGDLVLHAYPNVIPTWSPPVAAPPMPGEILATNICSMDRETLAPMSVRRLLDGTWVLRLPERKSLILVRR